MASLKERLIQFVLRGKDELSPAAKKSEEALSSLKDASEQLGQALDTAKDARSLARGLQQTQRAAEQAERSLVQADLQVKELRDALTAAPGSEGLQQSLKEAEREARRLQRGLDTLRSGLADQQAAARAAGIDTDNLADEEKRLAAEVDKARQALDANNAQLKAAQREQAATARATAEHTSRVDAARESMSRGAKQVLAFAAAYISLNAAFGLVQRGLNAVAGGIRSMLSTGDDFELLGKRMASLMGSVAEGERATAWIKQFAKDTPLQVQDVTEAFALLKSYGLDPMDGTLQAVVDKNEQLGGGMERLQGIASALGQAYAKQKLQTEEILQLVERGVPVWSMLEKVTGKNAAQLADLASKGRLGRDVIAALVKEIGASAEGAAADNMGTLTGLVSNLSDTWTDFLDRIAKSGALDYAKQQLAGVADYIEQMDRDGRLDKLAQSLSKAFEQGSEKAKEFLGRLVDIDFNKLIDDSSAFFNEFSSKIDSAAQGVQLFFAPFRTLFNGLTAGLSGIAAAFTGTVGLMLGAVEAVANKVPDMLGGEKIRAGVKSAREAINGLRDGFVAQIEQDGQDIRDAWDTTTQSAVKNAQAQQDAAKAAEQAKVDAAQATADKLNELNAQFAQRALEAAVTGQRAIAGMADALNLIDTASTQEQLEGLRRALLDAYQSGRLSQEEYAQATGVLNKRLGDLGKAAGGAADLVSDLDDKLGDLKAVQDAIRNARTDVDINNIRAALRRLYSTGQIDAQEYAKAQDELNQRVAELKPAAEESTKAVKDQGEALEGTASRVRNVGDAAEEAGSGLDFFGAVLTAARTPLANMSEAALAAFDALQGINNAEVQPDLGSVEGITEALAKAKNEAGLLQAELGLIGSRDYGLGIWMRETALRSREVQARFLEQRLELQRLMEGYESGSTSLASFVGAARSAQNNLDLLDSSDLSQLESAIASAEQRMQQLGESSRNTLASLQDELDKVRGNEDAIERRRAAQRRRELEQQLSDARQGGDSQAVANLQQSLSLLRQIEAETAQQREQQANQQRAAQQQATPAAPAQQAEPTKVIRLETARGRRVDVSVPAGGEDALLGILEEAGLRSL
ncbi:tape measure domain-containing protein [Pseudomonas sp. ALS1131]|nr:tape measure protein [Pseudomonas sp. ALS1131]TRO38556.1 tape measure domain-containing protein [Pseudomonas sp. ALS1131]